MPIFDPPISPNSNSVVPQSAIDRVPAPVDVGTPAVNVIPRSAVDRKPAPVDVGILPVPVVPVSAVDRKPDPVDPSVALGTPSGPAAPISVAAPIKETPVIPAPAFTPTTVAPATVVKYLSISDEGVGINTNVTAMNFTGDGVVVTNNSNGANAVNVTINGGGASYGNSNVVTLLAGFGSNVLSTTGNVTGGNLITSAQVVASGVIQSGTGLSTGGYLSVNGTADLHNTTVTGNLSATGNVTGNYVLGNGSQLTGLPATYSNANVQSYLPTYSGNVGALTVTGNLTVTGTTTTVNTEIVNVSESVVGNVDAGNLRTVGQVTATGNITAGNISTVGKVIAGNLDAINLVVNNISSDDSTLVSVQDGLQVYGDIIADNIIVANSMSFSNGSTLSSAAWELVDSISANFVGCATPTVTGTYSMQYYIDNYNELWISFQSGQNYPGWIGSTHIPTVALFANSVYTSTCTTSGSPNVPSIQWFDISNTRVRISMATTQYTGNINIYAR